MHTGAVITQVNSLTVPFAADRAAVTLDFGVDAPVLNQVTSLSKCFTTRFAYKWLVTRMNELVY